MIGLGIAIVVVGVLIVAMVGWAVINKLRLEKGKKDHHEKQEPTVDDMGSLYETAEPVPVSEPQDEELPLNKEDLNLDIEAVLRNTDKGFDDLSVHNQEEYFHSTLHDDAFDPAVGMDAYKVGQPNLSESIVLTETSRLSSISNSDSSSNSNPNPNPQHSHIVVQVMAPRSRTYEGNRICDVLEDLGLVLNSKGMFFAYDAEGAPEYQVVSMLEPGCFDLNTIDTYSTPGVVFMMDIQFASEPRTAFKSMLSVVHEVSYRLGADILDENRQRLNHAMITEYLARIKVHEYELQGSGI